MNSVADKEEGKATRSSKEESPQVLVDLTR